MRFLITKGFFDDLGSEFNEVVAVYPESELDAAIEVFAELEYRACDEDLEYVDVCMYGTKALYADADVEGNLTDSALFLIGCDECGSEHFDTMDDLLPTHLDDIRAAAASYRG